MENNKRQVISIKSYYGDDKLEKRLSLLLSEEYGFEILDELLTENLHMLLVKVYESKIKFKPQVSHVTSCI